MVARAQGGERLSAETLRQMQISLPGGRNVPLEQVATLHYGFDQPIVWRRQRVPTITIQADLAGSVQAATMVKRLAPKMAELSASLPPGYHINVGGTVEESAKGQNSVVAKVPIMIVPDADRFNGTVTKLPAAGVSHLRGTAWTDRRGGDSSFYRYADGICLHYW